MSIASFNIHFSRSKSSLRLVQTVLVLCISERLREKKTIHFSTIWLLQFCHLMVSFSFLHPTTERWRDDGKKMTANTENITHNNITIADACQSWRRWHIHGAYLHLAYKNECAIVSVTALLCISFNGGDNSDNNDRRWRKQSIYFSLDREMHVKSGWVALRCLLCKQIKQCWRHYCWQNCDNGFITELKTKQTCMHFHPFTTTGVFFHTLHKSVLKFVHVSKFRTWDLNNRIDRLFIRSVASFLFVLHFISIDW